MSKSLIYREEIEVGGVTYTFTRTKTAGALKVISETIPADSTDLAVLFNLDVSQCKAFLLVADTTVTVKTNSSSVPDYTFSGTIDWPYVWTQGSVEAFVLTDDVTALYVTEEDSTTGVLTVIALEDPTP